MGLTQNYGGAAEKLILSGADLAVQEPYSGTDHLPEVSQKLNM